MSRMFSTRQLAQMWNVSESTIKRWSDSGDLDCERTPGGHRRFRIEHLLHFQKKVGLNADLTDWAVHHPELGALFLTRNMDQLREEFYHLAAANQLRSLSKFLETLYLRGVGLVELYDEILLPTLDRASENHQREELAFGQMQLILNNIEESMHRFWPAVIRQPSNGKMALCGSPDSDRPLAVNGLCRVLQLSGWETLNLGHHVGYEAMAEMVRLEPVNLVCVAGANNVLAPPPEEVTLLARVAGSYRIPVILFGLEFPPIVTRFLGEDGLCQNFRAFSSYLLSIEKQ